MAADEGKGEDGSRQLLAELDLSLAESTSNPSLKLIGAPSEGLITIDDLVGPGFTQQLLRILQRHESSTGIPLNAAGHGLWDPEYQVIFQKIGDRLWTALKSGEHSDSLCKALDIEEQTLEGDCPLAVIDGYAIRYVAPQDVAPEDCEHVVDHEHPAHTDDCSLTVNLCLGVEPFAGGALEFSHGWHFDGKKVIVEHAIGTAVVHPGKLSHRALPMREGTRYNLIIWFESLSRHAKSGEFGKLVLKEMADTERMYLDALNSLTGFFSEMKTVSPRIEEAAAVVEQMKAFHASVLSASQNLADFAHSPSFSEPENHPEFLEGLRTLRTLFMQNAKLYIEYCTRHPALVRLIEENKKAKKILAKLDPEFAFRGHLNHPIRRICKYPLLFRELDKYYNTRYHLTYSLPHTPRLEELRDLTADVSSVVSAINQTTRQRNEAEAAKEAAKATSQGKKQKKQKKQKKTSR